MRKTKFNVVVASAISGALLAPSAFAAAAYTQPTMSTDDITASIGTLLVFSAVLYVGKRVLGLFKR